MAKAAAALSKAAAAGKRTPRQRMPSQRKKQAVVVIHGMGEQRPMDTLRSFVETVWAKDRTVSKEQPATTDNRYWSKPYDRTGSLELRRLTTPGDKNGIRTDFYEFYWADIMQGTLTQHLWSWVSGLLLRSVRQVPFDVLHVWVLLWIIALVIAAMSLVVAFPDANAAPWTWSYFVDLKTYFPMKQFLAWDRGVLSGVTVLLGIVTHRFLVPYFGDVARYVRADPANIQKRKEVMERGLALLRGLHYSEDGKPSEYDRIIVVGHSLGTNVAYDLITHLWAEYYQHFKITKTNKLGKNVGAIEKFFNHADKDNPFPEPFNVKGFRKAQHDLYGALRDQPERPWLISDFVTIGSPLTHAEFLITRTKKQLSLKQQLREIPTCPPTPERPGNKWTITYHPSGEKHRLMHHACLFAPVRWTNVYCRNALAHLFVLPGDIISGPVARHFKPGVIDKRVWIWHWTLGFAHTAYWTWKSDFQVDNPPNHIKILRDALNLRDKGDPFMKWVKED
ncbi:MAG: hypothetical protein ACE5FM_05110 [Methyloligellaceae bacterium]